MTNDVGYLFMSLLVICLFFLEKCLVKYFAHFFGWVWFFGWDVGVIYIFWILNPYQISYLRIFSPILWIVFSLSFLIFFFKIFIYLFIYSCVGSSFLCEGFLQLRRAGATLHRGARASHYCGLSCWRSTGSRRAGSVIVAHGPSCSAACGILPDQGSNPCPLHWQADSQPLRHQGSPHSLDRILWCF